MARDEEERRAQRSAVEAIAHEIFEYADERVGHAENVPKQDLMLACYHRLGELLAEWAKKLDKLEKVHEEPEWLNKYFEKKQTIQGRQMVSIDSTSLGFSVDNLFFANERGEGEKSLTDDKILISEPISMIKEDFKNLLTFCDDNGLEFYVDGFSTKQPGRTFRVSVYLPKLQATSRLELREKSIIALKLFKELSNTSTGIQAVERKVFVNELLKSGGFDQLLASKVVDLLLTSGQIPKSLIV